MTKTEKIANDFADKHGLGIDTYILNDTGEPVPEPDILKWGKWMGEQERHVAQDLTPRGVRVSTVFLGLDHSWDGTTPVLWETMIFGGKEDGYQERYSTKDAALEGHMTAWKLALKAEELTDYKGRQG